MNKTIQTNSTVKWGLLEVMRITSLMEETKVKESVCEILKKYDIEKTQESLKKSGSLMINYTLLIKLMGLKVNLSLNKLAFMIDYGEDLIELPSLDYMQERIGNRDKIDEKYEDLICMALYCYMTGIASEKAYIELHKCRIHFMNMQEAFYDKAV